MNAFAKIVITSVLLVFAFIVWLSFVLIQHGQYEMALWFGGIAIVVWMFTISLIMAAIYGAEE